MEDQGAKKLAGDAVAVAADALAGDGRLSPFLIVELAGLRDIEHFGPNAVDAARSRASELARSSADSQWCALVHQGRVGLDQAAILIEVQRPGEAEVEVFCQRFRPKGGRFRGFKLIGDVTSAGRRETPS